MLAGLGIVIAGCAKTISAQPGVVSSVESGTSPAITGFFGSDAALLQPGQEGQAAMVYVNPNVQWKQYEKILVEPVQFWDDPDTKVSLENQRVLTDYLHNQLKTELEKNFTLVNQGGPGVIQLQVALINASASTPGLRTVSVLVPQARILTAGASLATGSYAFAGSAEAEMKATDASTGQLLAAGVDKRSGGMALTSGFQGTWGDARNAMDYWAERISNRLLALQGRQPAAG
ncbi:MAG: DUF3313 domain-containing protein [Candidatus Binataceae bacterium]